MVSNLKTPQLGVANIVYCILLSQRNEVETQFKNKDDDIVVTLSYSIPRMPRLCHEVDDGIRALARSPGHL